MEQQLLSFVARNLEASPSSQAGSKEREEELLVLN